MYQIESLQDIQKEIEYIIDGMSRNHPLREHLVIANVKLEKLIKDHKLYEVHYE